MKENHDGEQRRDWITHINELFKSGKRRGWV